jgi:hypothetical protein
VSSICRGIAGPHALKPRIALVVHGSLSITDRMAWGKRTVNKQSVREGADAIFGAGGHCANATREPRATRHTPPPHTRPPHAGHAFPISTSASCIGPDPRQRHLDPTTTRLARVPRY